MKILHIITRLDKGGSSENVLLTCEYFYLKRQPIKNEYEIVLIYGGNKDFSSWSKGLRIKSYYLKELQRSIHPLKDFVAFVKTFSIIKKEKPNIIHTHSSKAGIIGRWAAFIARILDLKLRNVKIIHTPHGHIFYGYYNKFITFMFVLIEKITALITNKIIALTEGEKNETLTYGVGSTEQWVVIHSGVDYKIQIVSSELENLMKELNIKENEIIIGTVARLEPVKGVRYFIDAIIHLSYNYSNVITKNLTFLIIGDGSERKMLEKKLTRQNFILNKVYLSDVKARIFEITVQNKSIKVIFTGMREDVAKLISIMDIYVQPSINEGMGKTIVLAQLLGKPVVATKVQGIPSVVLDNKTGILVEPKNSWKLANGIFDLIKDEEKRMMFGNNAKMWVNEIIDSFPRFSIERMVYLLEQLYHSL
ncbi:MAG: glycosyltransferase [Endomicrobia bacterium]|nr:glycosyltransferase [Endomicrobiia bacterium]